LRCTTDKGFAKGDSGVGEEVACWRVVSAIENYIVILEETNCIGRGKGLNYAIDFQSRVEPTRKERIRELGRTEKWV